MTVATFNRLIGGYKKMISLYNEDALILMSRLQNNSVDLLITDPPYKLVQGGCTNNAVTFSGSKETKSGKVFENNSIKFIDWLYEAYRCLKDGSHCYVMCNDRNMSELLTSSEKAGFKLLNILTWKKKKHSPNRYYLKNSEFIVMLRKGKAKNINNMGTFSVLEVDNVEKKTHPSEKPVELLKILIENSSKPGELVFDPFVGSGSIIEACFNSNRFFIGSEIDKKYFDLAKNRIVFSEKENKK